MPSFQIARLPHLLFGSETIKQLPSQIQYFGDHLLLVMGASSFQQTSYWQALQTQLIAQNTQYTVVSIKDEPAPDLIDRIVKDHAHLSIDVVVGLGGGSVLDAAKAIAGLIPSQTSVLDYLEGVGPELPFNSETIPFIAVPTTAGTGSEATKNAVLSLRGANGYKKSFRHERLVAQVAIVDPDLLASCPSNLLAANAMDAFTQLMESYVSLNANPFTDALAWSGIESLRMGLMPAWQQNNEIEAKQGREKLAYASYLSGVTLAQVGLGSVHGLASPLGAFFPIPHGVVCGTLMAEATAINIAALQQRDPTSQILQKYAKLGRLLSEKNLDEGQNALLELLKILRHWTDTLQLPRLAAYGIQAQDLPHIVANSRGSSMKTNPIALTDAEITDLLQRRL